MGALIAATVCSCNCPPPPPPAPPPIPIVIGTDCDIASPPALVNGDMVQLCYFGTCEWTDVDFGGTALFGPAKIRLNRGESVVLRVIAPASTSYTLTIDCSCDSGGGHTTPEIKVGPPPPPEP